MAGKKGCSGRRKGSLSWSKIRRRSPGTISTASLRCGSPACQYRRALTGGWCSRPGAGTLCRRSSSVRWPKPPSSTSCGWTPKLSSRVGGTDRRSNGRALIKCWRGRAGWRRPLRYAARPTVQRGRRRRGHGRSGSYDWRDRRGKPGVTGSVRFCSLVAAGVEFHPPTF